MGATDAQLAALDGGDRSSFTAAERAALAFAEAMTPTGGRAADALYEELAAHWQPAQIVEITAVVGLFNYFNRFAEALHVPVTGPP